MAGSRKFVKVFLASPSDLGEERRIAKQIVDDFNSDLAEAFGYQVDLVGWEDTLPGVGRPQALINRDLKGSDLFVGLLWKRWGTPPGGQYTSGFEEEFEISAARSRAQGSPEIFLMFKEIDEESLRDPGEQLKKVQEFRQRIYSAREIFADKFSEVRDFEKRFRKCLIGYVNKLARQSSGETSEKGQQANFDTSATEILEPEHSTAEPLFSREGTRFLREAITRVEEGGERAVLAPEEIARMRLLSLIVGLQSNDNEVLGVHDSNLLYREKDKFTFSETERRGLIASGLQNYEYQNVPLWHWLISKEGLEADWLPFASAGGSSDNQRIGALTAMTLISEPLPDGMPREIFVKPWLRKNASRGVRVAALNYLGKCGIPEDLSYVRKEFDKNDSQTTSAAADALLRIALRQSRKGAVGLLYELQPTSISADLASEIYGDGTAFSKQELSQGIDHQSIAVRRLVVKILRERKELSAEQAERLSEDTDAPIRYEALLALIGHGRTFPDDEAEKRLVRKRRGTQGLGSLVGGLGLLGGGFLVAEKEGQNFYEMFCDQQRRLMPSKELEIQSRRALLDLDAYFLLADREFKRRSPELRRAIRDHFSGHFAELLQRHSEIFGGREDRLESVKSLEEFLRKKFTRQGLDVICKKGGRGDLPLVRETLNSGYIDFAEVDVDYLKKCGDWEDIPLIVESVERRGVARPFSLLATESGEKYRRAAIAIYKLGQSRFGELLRLGLPSSIMAQLIAHCSDGSMRKLKDQAVIELLLLEDESVRKRAALKAVRALPKNRVRKLLANYAAREQFYYNVIHWLDFGISVPAEKSGRAISGVLSGS